MVKVKSAAAGPASSAVSISSGTGRVFFLRNELGVWAVYSNRSARASKDHHCIFGLQ